MITSPELFDLEAVVIAVVSAAPVPVVMGLLWWAARMRTRADAEDDGSTASSEWVEPYPRVPPATGTTPHGD